MEPTGVTLSSRRESFPVPSADLWENLAFNLWHVVPYYLQGIFSRRPGWVRFWSTIHPDPLGVDFFHALRQRHGRYVWLRMLFNKSLFVLEPNGIRHVLDHSPEIYAEAELKRRGMSHFQPGAVTISRGAEWKERRRFNTEVLEASSPRHSHSVRFLDIINREVKAVLPPHKAKLRWDDFEHLFRRITLQVIFGRKAADDLPIASELHTLMQESNRIFLLRKSRKFDDFYERLRAHLRRSEDASLAQKVSQTSSSAVTRVENQVPHWMFAMMDTLSINVARALALIVTFPEVEQRVRLELQQHGTATPEAIEKARYLQGCLQEAMRLWPTTPLLARETTKPDEIEGRHVPAKSQVIIFNNFLHRDWETIPFADAFNPDHWLESDIDYRFNHLSNGTQVCAGKHLAIFIGTAMLALLIRYGRYRLRSPRLRNRYRVPHVFNEFKVRFDYAPPFHVP